MSKLETTNRALPGAFADRRVEGAEFSSPPVAGEAKGISPVLVAGGVRLADVLLSTVLSALVFFLYLGQSDDISVEIYQLSIALAAILQLAIFQFVGVYEWDSLRHGRGNVKRLFLGWALLYCALVVIAAATKTTEHFSRVWLHLWFASGLVALVASRFVLQRLFERWSRQGRLSRRVVIVGAGDRAHSLIKAIENNPESDLVVCGVFDDREGRVPDIVSGYPKLGSVDKLLEFARNFHIDLLIVALPMAAEDRVFEVLKKIWVLPIDVRISATSQPLRFSSKAYKYVGNIPLLAVFDRPITGWDYVVKSIEDRVLAMFFIVLLSPIMLLTALLIKLDSKGPVFFKQKRYGFNNELIEVYKFRTLYHERRDEKADKLVSKNDPRVTRIGRFLRKSSIDELPQFFSVLKGDMSIVGPRPHAVHAKAGDQLYPDAVAEYFARHRVKPGITGWAQVNGWRGETDTDEKIQRRTEFDLFYIENWSIRFDLLIVLMTPFSLLTAKNAH